MTFMKVNQDLIHASITTRDLQEANAGTEVATFTLHSNMNETMRVAISRFAVRELAEAFERADREEELPSSFILVSMAISDLERE